MAGAKRRPQIAFDVEVAVEVGFAHADVAECGNPPFDGPVAEAHRKRGRVPGRLR